MLWVSNHERWPLPGRKVKKIAEKAPGHDHAAHQRHQCHHRAEAHNPAPKYGGQVVQGKVEVIEKFAAVGGALEQYGALGRRQQGPFTIAVALPGCFDHVVARPGQVNLSLAAPAASCASLASARCAVCLVEPCWPSRQFWTQPLSQFFARVADATSIENRVQQPAGQHAGSREAAIHNNLS